MGSADKAVYLIQHLAAVIGKQSDQVLKKELGIGLSQYRILMVLEWNPRLSQRRIADSLGQTEASVSRQIGLLIDQGLLVSKNDPENRRKHIALPTTKGMQVTEAAADVLRRYIDKNLSGGDDLVQLAVDLRKLHTAVCRPGKPGACSHQMSL